jgi:hypothetical protein
MPQGAFLNSRWARAANSEGKQNKNVVFSARAWPPFTVVPRLATSAARPVHFCGHEAQQIQHWQTALLLFAD